MEMRIDVKHSPLFCRLSRMLVLLAAVLIQQPAQGQSEETPLWKFGIPTFSGNVFAGKTTAEQAQSGPTFQLPSPDTVIPPAAPDVGATATQSKTTTPKFAPVGYQLNPAETVSTAPSLPTIPDLPPGLLDLPTVPESPLGDPQSPIGQAIAAGATAEVAPLADETQSWYEIPWNWVTQGWKNHAELGLDGSSGNSRTLAFQTGLEMKRKTDRYTLALDFDYRKASTTGITTEDNGRLDLDYDRLFQDSKWSAFGKFGAEWDQFKAFDSRLNLNGGLGYHFIRTDDASFSTKFGAGASKEIGAPDDDWKPEAVFGATGEYQLNRYNKMKAKIDYFPAWENFSDYRVVSDIAWEILLDDADNLSLKLALTDRYDSTPQGAKPNDVYYSLLLLVKF